MGREEPGEVLVVGAGPTGLTLAITLARSGRTVRIVDRAAAPAAVSKALAVWSGSLEALHGTGVLDAFLEAGRRMRALTVVSGRRRLAEMRVGEGIDSPYPFPLLLPQSRTEQLLAGRLESGGTRIERGVELVGLMQDAEAATATLRHPDGRLEEARFRYVVGCDGARSFVRHALDISFDGYTEPYTYILGDVHIDGGGLDDRSIYLSWRHGGTIALFPFEAGVWRIFGVRGPIAADAGDEPPPSLEELQGQVDRHGPGGLRLRDPHWLSTFRINERLAARYRKGCCLLAGDAAHIHSPAGGQGMNTGIQDAVNLGWKLAHVLGGFGDADLLLESYEAERRPVARHVIDTSAMRQHVAFSSNPVLRVVRDLAVGIVGNIAAAQRKLQVELSETDIVYRSGPLVALGRPPRLARRADVGGRARDVAIRDPVTGETTALWPLLSELRHCLLLFDGGNASAGTAVPTEGTGDRLRVLRFDEKTDPDGRARARYGLRGPGWVLVRPDQVVAARGNGRDFARLAAYLDRVVRPSAA